MRILMGVHGVPPDAVGGTELVALRLARSLARRFDVTLFHPLPAGKYPLGLEYRRYWEGVRILGRVLSKPATFPHTYRLPEAEAWFESLLREFRPDICHFQHLTGLSMFLPVMAKVQNIPVVMTLHDYWLPCARGQLVDLELAPCAGPRAGLCVRCLADQLALDRPVGKLAGSIIRLTKVSPAIVEKAKQRFLGGPLEVRIGPGDADRARAERRLEAALVALRACSLLTAPSRHLLNFYRRFGLDPGTMRFLPNGVDARPAVRPASPPSRPLEIVFIGAIIPTKGPHLLLEACKDLPAGEFRLSLIGPSPPFHRRPEYAGQVKAAARAMGAEVTGPIPPEEIPGRLARAHLLVLPSIWAENAPLVIQEAFRMGVPVVASRVGGIPELVREGVNGRLFPPGDVGALRSVLTEFFQNPLQVEQLRDGAWKTSLPSRVEEVDAWGYIYSGLLR